MWEHGNQIALTGFWHVSTQQVTAITLRMIYLNAQVLFFLNIYIYVCILYLLHYNANLPFYICSQLFERLL